MFILSSYLVLENEKFFFFFLFFSFKIVNKGICYFGVDLEYPNFLLFHPSCV